MDAQSILLRISFPYWVGFGLCLDRLSIRPRGPRSRCTMFSDHAITAIAICRGVRAVRNQGEDIGHAGNLGFIGSDE
jgi:hypothetical protein